MEQQDNILQELKELDSLLAHTTPSVVYQAPAGYFDGLADQVMNRIRALDALTPQEELGHLSPLLAGISRKLPYTMPAGYLEQLDPVMAMDLTGQEELEMLSPLLSGLKKQAPYTVPAGYFDTLSPLIKEERPAPAKVIPMGTRKWLRYAAAAVTIGVVAMGSLLFFNRNQAGTVSVKNSYAWVEKNMSKVSTDDIDHFVQLVDEKQPVITALAAQDEIKNLMKNVPDREIQDFLNDTQAGDPLFDDDDDIILN